MTILFLILRVTAALLAARFVGWPLAKLLWRLSLQGWPFCKAAWAGVMRAFGNNPLLFIVTMVLFAAMGAALNGLGHLPRLLFAPEAEKTTWTNGAAYAGMRLGVALLSVGILAPMMVSAHRTVLGDRLQAGWSSALRNYLGWLLALAALASLSLNFSLIASAVGLVRNLMVLIAQIGLLILAVRLALLPSDVAIGVPARSAEARIATSLDIMEDRFWSTLGLLFLTLLPMLVLMFILHRIGVPRIPNPPPIPTPPPAPPPVTKLLLIGRGLEGVAQVFTVALAVSAASQLYARLMPRRA